MPLLLIVFFFNDTATTEIYTLSLHDALPIFDCPKACRPYLSRMATGSRSMSNARATLPEVSTERDRKSTRLNSSHTVISYAVFCLKKKKKKKKYTKIQYVKKYARNLR